MKAPEVDVTLSTGEVKPLRALYEKERLALVFLRHFGCTFCREHVRELRRLPELNIAFVTLGTPEQAEDFRQNMSSPHVFISDPNKKLHGLFNLERGGLAQILNPHTVVRGIAATFRGIMMGKPIGDPMQMPGVFLIDSDGDVTWEKRARDIADNPSGREISRHLQAPGHSEA